MLQLLREASRRSMQSLYAKKKRKKNLFFHTTESTVIETPKEVDEIDFEKQLEESLKDL